MRQHDWHVREYCAVRANELWRVRETGCLWSWLQDHEAEYVSLIARVRAWKCRKAS